MARSQAAYCSWIFKKNSGRGDTVIKAKSISDKAHARMKARIKNMMADGPMGRKVVGLALKAYNIMRATVHKDTRALMASITISKRRYSATNVIAQVYLNPNVKNPRTKNRPADYGKFENARGGAHAFLDRTARQMKNTEAVEIAELTRIIIDGA